MREDPEADLVLTHSSLLGERLYLFSHLRFIAAAGILIGALFATYVVGISGLNLPGLAGLAVALASYNVAIFFAVRPHRAPNQGKPRLRCLTCVAHLSIFSDYLVLTLGIWFVGGGSSPFLAFYLLHAILAAVLLSRRSAYGHATIGYLFLAALVLGEWSGLIPRIQPIGAIPREHDADFRVVLTILFVYGLLTVVTTVLTTGIVKQLRAHEQALQAARSRLEHLATMRRSFLHVVLHNVRSPVGTVVTMLEGLANGLDGTINEAQQARLRRAGARLQDILEMSRSLRVLADLETESLESLMAPLDISTLINATVADHLELAASRNQKFVIDIPEALPTVSGVERLLREALANYLNNATKYSHEGKAITVRARADNAHVRIEVVDTGPGISEEAKAKLFQEFSRLPPAGKLAPKTSGLGLGLSIVRRIAEAHKGSAGVEGSEGEGSCFFIELPIIGR